MKENKNDKIGPFRKETLKTVAKYGLIAVGILGLFSLV